MLLLRLWNYIRGYVIIIVEGYFLEKFINICIHRQIFLWDIKRKKNCVMTLKVSINGFKLLRPIARKTNCRVRIAAKKGLPFAIYRYKGRKAFVLGAAVFVVLLYSLTSFIWSIEINGNKNVESQTIIDKLASYGVKTGVLKFGINTDEIVNSMMLDFNDFAWLEVSLKGTKLKVEIVERVKPPSLIPKNVPCDVIASRDGVIKSIQAKIGQQAVKTGETVTAGQVLIAGTIISQNKDIPPKQVHASGEISARTWYEKELPVKVKILERERTGKYKNNYSIVLLIKRFNLFHKISSFENYDKIEIKRRVSFGEDLELPFELIIDRYYEIKIIEREIDIEEAKKIAAENASKELQKEIPTDADIVKTDLKFIEKENGDLVANVVIECLEDIGVTKEIGGN